MNGPPARLHGSRVDREERIALAGLLTLLVVTAGWWALALWPVADGPEWLERTRYVCFGVRDSGLPDGGGWVGLVGSPLGMLGVLIVGWRPGVTRLVRRTRSSRLLAGFATLLLMIVLVLAGGLVRSAYARATSTPDPAATLAADEHPRLDRAAPPLSLIGQDGAVHTLADARGRPILVTFAFGHCETICPVIVKQVVAAHAELAVAGTQADIFIVTVDPWRDVPSRLRYIADAWDLPSRGAWVLSGDIASVEATLDAWGVTRQRDLRNGAITHPPLVYIVDSDGRIAFATTGGTTVLRQLVERL